MRADPGEEKVRVALWDAFGALRDATIATIEAAADPGTPTGEYRKRRELQVKREQELRQAQAAYLRVLQHHYAAHPENSVNPEQARKRLGA